MKMKREFLSFLLLMWCFAILSCEDVRFKKITPKEFLNRTVVSSDLYSRDSIELIKQLKELLRKREGYFSNTAYYDSSQLIIDSILYSPDFEKMAIFVIVMNPTSRQLVPEKESKWYFNGTCYLGKRNTRHTPMFWLGPNFSNFSNRRLLSVSMRNSYFTEFAISDTNGKHLYPYNLNDVRFWDSSIWDELKF